MLNVISGRRCDPRRIVVYGVGGIGKGTWAAGAPAPIFIQTEDGNGDIGVDRLPLCRSLGAVQSQLRQVFTDEHAYQTLVIDSLDQLEPLIWAGVAADAGKASVSEIGFGKGYEAALVDWRKILFTLDKIRELRGMTVILIAHAKVERFEDPQNDAYDRYSLQLHKKAAAEISHWTDELLFANYVSHVRKLDDGRRERSIGVGSGQRVIHTQEMPAFIAKSRITIPPEIPMPLVGGWDLFASYFNTPAPVAVETVASSLDAGSCEPANEATGVPSDDDVAIPADIVTMAQAAGLVPVDLDALDVEGLREIALAMIHRFNQREAAAMKKAVAERNAEKMRELVRRVQAKPQTDAITG